MSSTRRKRPRLAEYLDIAESEKKKKTVAIEQFKKCYDTGRFTDLSILCGGEEFRCHKVIVCSQSKFFDVACTGGFQEAQTSIINLPDDKPYHVTLMLEFLYHQTYTTEDTDDTMSDQSNPKYVPGAHIALYALGDKYEIPDLCNLAADRFAQILGSLSSTNLPQCVSAIYSTTPAQNRALRDPIILAIVCRSGAQTNQWYCKTLLDRCHEIEQFRDDLILGLLCRWSPATYGANHSDSFKNLQLEYEELHRSIDKKRMANENLTVNTQGHKTS